MNKISPKVKMIITHQGAEDLEKKINGFLSDIDVRQIVKIQYQYPEISRHCCMILYVNLEDVRDLKIESVLD